MAGRKQRKNDRFDLVPHTEKSIFSLQEIGQRQGWQFSLFHIEELHKYSQGEEVKVAVLDTGVDLTHQDLKESLIEGKNIVQPTKQPYDLNHHGSHCSGIIAATDNKTGIIGIAPKSKIIPIKVLDDKGSGGLKQIVDGIYSAVALDADFLNLSLGNPSPVPELLKAIQYAQSRGRVVICAAGNSGNTKQIMYPAAYKEAISVGAIDERFNKADFSCTGQSLDFMAPGVDIFSTIPNNWYSSMSGTSMAAPFVTGICALILSYKRKHKLSVKLSCAEDYRNILKNCCVSIPNLSKKEQGYGILDPLKLLEFMKKLS
jgi:major intracellular serine protease